jgi:hypothetical protein
VGTQADVRIAGVPPQLSTLAAAAHIGAREAVRRGQVDYAVVKENLPRIPELRDELHPRFFETMMAETDARALEDEEFAEALARSARQIDREGRKLQRIPSPFITHASPECCTFRINNWVPFNNVCLPDGWFWVCAGMIAVVVICCIIVIIVAIIV